MLNDFSNVGQGIITIAGFEFCVRKEQNYDRISYMGASKPVWKNEICSLTFSFDADRIADFKDIFDTELWTMEFDAVDCLSYELDHDVQGKWIVSSQVVNALTIIAVNMDVMTYDQLSDVLGLDSAGHRHGGRDIVIVPKYVALPTYKNLEVVSTLRRNKSRYGPRKVMTHSPNKKAYDSVFGHPIVPLGHGQVFMYRDTYDFLYSDFD